MLKLYQISLEWKIPPYSYTFSNRHF